MNERQAREQSSLVIGAQLLAGLWALPIAAAALLLLAVADTWAGRGFAILSLLAAVLPYAVLTAWASRTKRWLRAVAIMGGLALGILATLLGKIITAKPAAKPGRVTNHFARQPGAWLRYSPTKLVPEGDQLLFSFTVMAALDPVLTLEKAGGLGRMTATIYREQANDPDFVELGSVMPEAYAELFGFPQDSGHAYVYTPRQLDRTKPAAVLVFFHGSGGNFKAYLWELAELADRLGVILVAPSSGFGLWHPRQTEAALEAALAAASQVTPIDAQRVHLLGLSNGGRAVSQLAAAEGMRFKSITFLSPVFDPRALGSTTFARQASGHSLLVVTGALDDRTPVDYVEGNVRDLMRAGARVEVKTIADADHFLMFSHRRQLVEILTVWFGRH